MTWVVLAGVGAGSFVFRVGPMLVLQRVSLSEVGDRLIRHAGTAAIAALISLSTKQSATGGAVLPAVLAVAGATVFAARGASMILLLAAGGAIYAGSVIVMNLIAR